MYRSLLLKVFPVVAILMGLAAKYCINILETRLNTIINEQLEFPSSLHLHLLQGDATINPIASAHGLLAFSNNLLNSEPAEWIPTLNVGGAVVDSRAVMIDSGEVGSQLLPVHRISMTVKSNLNETQLFQRLTSVTGLECVYPRFFSATKATVTRPVLMQYDWQAGLLSIDQISSPFVWPFYTRTFTVFTINHPETRTFIAQSIQLSPLDEKVLLPTPLKNKGTKKATLSISLRVRRSPNSNAVVSDSNTSESYKIEVLYFVSGVVARAEVDHYINMQYFIPNVVRSIAKLFA